MDAGEMVFAVSRLGTGAAAAFFAIMLRTRLRDPAWFLILAGAITDYAEALYSILSRFGITSGPVLESVSLAAIALPAVRNVFFIAAFAVMAFRTFRNTKE
jgi:hypothetical protein